MSDKLYWSISDKRLALIKYLLRRCGSDNRYDDWLATCAFSAMDDGGMGGFYIGDRVVGLGTRAKITAVYDDEDGTEVHITLYCNGDGRPIELDFWKVTFEPLIKFPTENEIFNVECLESR